MKQIMKLAGILALMRLLYSCDMLATETMSIPDRIQAFEDDLNNGDYTLQNHFHPDMSGYDNYADAATLNTGVLGEANAPFSFGTPVVSGSSASGSFSSNGGADGSYTATMREDGADNWKIYEMKIYGSSTSSDYLPIRVLE